MNLLLSCLISGDFKERLCIQLIDYYALVKALARALVATVAYGKQGYSVFIGTTALQASFRAPLTRVGCNESNLVLRHQLHAQELLGHGPI